MSDEPPLTRAQSVRYGLGALSMLLAFVLFALLLLDMIFHLPVTMPATFYTNRPLWIGFVFGLIFAAWILQTPPVPQVKRWAPGRPGRRFTRLRIYGRNGCHLCDDAADLLERHGRWLPPLELVNVDEDPRLVEQFGDKVPVVELDGKIRFRGRVSEALLRRLIEGTPPSRD